MKDKIKVELNTGTLFLELMFLMFLGLKIAGLIDWSWWWVFAPIWLPIILVLAGIGLALLWVVIFTPKEGKK